MNKMTDLSNYIQPFIRYELTDRVIRKRLLHRQNATFRLSSKRKV